jgi:trimeric autotransporter adhesin
MKSFFVTVLCVLLFMLSAFSQLKPMPLPLSNPDDVYWDNQFGPSALGGGGDPTVRASTVDGYDIYLGGEFLYAGEKIVNHIVKWDGSNWSALGSGTDGNVMAVAVHNGKVYIGGYFTKAGGVTVNHVAMWDGSQWNTLGSGMTSGTVWTTSVFALAFIGDDLYAGGDFTSAGASTAHNIAKWDGSQWTEVDGGVNDVVRALAVSGSVLYAGGDFHWAGPVSGGTWAYNIARFDSSTWSAVGGGMDDAVACLAVNGTKVYAGGNFTKSGGVITNCIACWDGTQWLPLGDGVMPQSEDIAVDALCFIGTDLYVGGNFDIAHSPYDLVNIARWDGSGWSDCGPGFQGYQFYTSVYTLCSLNSNLYAGGFFTINGTVYMRDFGRWNGTQWFQVGTGHGKGMDSYINCLLGVGNSLWAGGMFNRAGDNQAAYIARWDGDSWHEPGGGTSYEVYDLMTLGTDLYVAGAFTYVGNQQIAGGIARWDGSQWHSLGQGFSSAVLSVAHLGNDIYIGRSFGAVNKWDGNSWSLVGGGTNGYEGVKALAVLGNDLFAGGDFTTAGNTDAKYIARWDGSQWNAVGGGMDAQVLTFCVIGNDLYAGGDFTAAGGATVNHLARWDGSQWHHVGGGTDGFVARLVNIEGELYAGGSFTMAGTTPANNIARWDGLSWTTFGSGTIDDVRAFAKLGYDLYTGGYFEQAGEKSSAFIARWLPSPVGKREIHVSKLNFSIEPNPSSDKTTATWTQKSAGDVGLEISDISGRILHKLLCKKMTAGNNRAIIDLDGFPEGLYLCRISCDSYSETIKLIVEK